MDAMSWNAPMKPIGSTHKVQQGDWLVTYEVIGWNERTQSNIWAEKKRQFHPRPSIEAAMRGIEAEQQYQRTKELHIITNRI
jgi:hypothetical protein